MSYKKVLIRSNALEIFDAAKSKIEAAWASKQPAPENEAAWVVESFHDLELLAEQDFIDPKEVEQRAFWLRQAGFQFD
jgi:hypothetical protein